MRQAMKALIVASAMAAVPLLANAAATVGQAAPDFSLTDLQGKAVKLSDYRGKYVVLEWVNPGCPFVQKHYNSGNMPQLQKDAGAQGVVWLAINSTAPEARDFKSPEDLAAWLKEKGAVPSAAMLDREGTVGKAYGAKTTPDMFVIDPKGTLIYAGAIDDKRSADPEDVKTAKNYVKAALEEAQAGKAVSKPTTSPYGCGIKYKS